MINKILKQIAVAALLFFSAGIVISSLLALVPDIYAQGNFISRLSANLRIYMTFDYNRVQFGSFSIWDIVRNRSMLSLYIISVAVFLVLIVGIPLGYYSSRKKHSLIVQILNKTVCSLSSIPILIWALLFNYVIFSFFRKSPSYDTIGSETVLWRYLFLILPPVTVMLGDGILADVIHRMKEETDTALNEEYITVLQAQGLSVIKHLFRALLPAIGSIFSGKISYLIGGIVVIEYVYNWKGLGWGILNGITRTGLKNYDFVLCASMFFVAVILAVHLISEIITILSDPRLRN